MGKDRAWGLWHIQEGEGLTGEICPSEIINEQKQLEWLTGRALIKTLAESLGLKYNGLNKDEFGKPFLNSHPHHISLSHSYPHVVAQIDRTSPVGIDLEQPKEKLRTIAHRVFSAGEVKDAGNDIIKLCIYWCAKEALYKFYGKRNLLFTDHLKVMPFTLSLSGSIEGKIQLPENEILVPLQYLVMKEFVIVYTDLQA
ncbi:MAG: 4'-phosphopantetheinyl transferase superfamily protein [Bacteroidota bacterium]